MANLALALLVLRHLANHPHNTVALDDLALIAYFFDAGPNFHINFACLLRLYTETRSWHCQTRQLLLSDARRNDTQDQRPGATRLTLLMPSSTIFVELDLLRANGNRYNRATMPVRPEDSLAKMIASLKETTGRTLEEWRLVISQTGLLKHGEVVSFLKSEHGITHGYANQIALNRNTEPPQAYADPLVAVFHRKELARQIYDLLMAKISMFGPDVDVAPKKAYISIRRKKQFAILQPAAGRLDVGINLPGTEANGRLEPAGSFNAMVTHRVRVGSVQEVDADLIEWLTSAYDAS